MAKLFPPIFMRLYASMVLALCAAIFITQQFTDSYLEQDTYNDFARDTLAIYQQQITKLQQENTDPNSYFSSLDHHYHFDLHWIPQWNEKTPCHSCELITSVNGLNLYVNDQNGIMLAAYPIADTQGALIISDRAPLALEEQNISEWYDDPEELVPFITFLVALLVIGTMLYLPTRQLQKQIDQLVRVHRKFGQGELEIRANDTIPDPLKELAGNFNQMAESIENKVSESLVFAQAVPHEMRTPLSRIQLASGLLRKSCTEQSQQALLNSIDTYIEDLDKLTIQIVNYSKVVSDSKLNITNGKEQSSTEQLLDLDAFISERLAILSPATDIAIELRIEDSSTLFCDPVYLRLLIDNLLKNALRYTKTTVVINVEHNESKLTIAVEDDGPGIPTEERDYIFIPFARLDKSRNSKTGGLGLGLAIAKAVATKLQGTLSIEEAKSGGARFVFKQ